MAGLNVWRRQWSDTIFSTGEFPQWNNNFLCQNLYSQTGALSLQRVIVDFQVRVTLVDEISGLTWQPDAMADMTILSGYQWSPDSSSFAPDLKTTSDVPLLGTQMLTPVDRWEFTNPATGGHEAAGRWFGSIQTHGRPLRKVPDSTVGAAVNFGILPYFAQSVATEGFVFSLRVTCWARTEWVAIP